MSLIAKFLSVAVTSSFVAFAGSRDNRCADRTQSRARTCGSYALFEFAPESGAGLGASCSCTTPSAATGEALTFTRASSAMCTKGPTTNTISNGDLVLCSSNQPRVMPGGNGSGGNGLLIERTRTNLLLRSEEIDNAAWAKNGVVVAAPTVTANYATAPDNAATAERLEFAATGSGEESSISQVPSAGAITASTLIYVKGTSGSGSLDVCTNTGAVDQCTTCAYNNTTWTRCGRELSTMGAGTNLSIGNLTRINGGTTRSANDVLIWGTQTEVTSGGGASATSYIPTTGATATRSSETATFPLTMANTTGSMAATVVYSYGLSSSGVDHALVANAAAGPAYRQTITWRPQAGPSLTGYSLTGSVVLAASAAATATHHRGFMFWTSATSATVSWNGSSSAGSLVAINSTTLVEIGTYSAGQHADGVIKRVCFDNAATRCF